MEIGQVVEYVDPVRQAYPAVITAVWGEGRTPSLNVVYVSGDETEVDSYGRQIKRSTSVPHETNQAAPGNFWRDIEV